MSYILRFFDKSLVYFDIISDAINGLSVKNIEVNENEKCFLPLDLELTDSGLLKWLKRRIIPKNRAFVQSFLAKLGLNPNDTKGIIDICKGLSVNDCYWITDDTFGGSFDKYNLYDNRFSRVLATIAYTGYGDTQRSGFVSTPELTTGGMLPKCWRRINGKIVLYKAGSTGAANAEPYSEFYAYQVAEAMGLKSVSYNLRKWKGKLFSTCELFTSKAFSYIPTGRIVKEGGWAAVMNYYRSLGGKYYHSLVDMLIFDAVVCNEDRHFGNFGLIVDNSTNSIVDTAPIFDNGLSLFNYAMEDDLRDIDTYAGTRLMATSQDFLAFAKEIITKDHNKLLKRLINFNFKRHSTYNLPKRRLRNIETFLQKRVRELLAISLHAKR